MRNMKKTTPSHIIIKLLKTSDKNKISKSLRKYMHFVQRYGLQQISHWQKIEAKKKK